MQKLNEFWQLLKGRKTILVGLLMIALGILTDNKEMAWNGLGFLAVRDAIGWKKE